MKINREKLDQLMSMNDEKLWEEIRKIAGAHGISLPTGAPPHAELEKMRAAVSKDKLSLGEAARIINSYKRGNR